MRARLLTASLLLVIAAAARAQTIEITPVAGYRAGGSFLATIGGEFADYDVDDAPAFGVHLGVRVSRDGELEVLYSRQETRLEVDSGLFAGGEPVLDLALETWQAGGNYLFGDEDARVRPYIGLGLGVTRLVPERAGLGDETRFSASFAAGAKVWLGRHVGVRVEARGFFTFLPSEGSMFCETGEGCQLHAEGEDISQAEVRAGLVLRF